MSNPTQLTLVYTVKNRCQVCYSCVRECPVKAIKIINGQAEVMHERCIACGSCVKVCSQGAKIYKLSIDDAIYKLENKTKMVIACVAPSFPAEFLEISDYTLFVGALKKLGFDKVIEVGFGADIVSLEYQKILYNVSEKPVISSDCPAIVNYIKHYHPDLVDNLVPVVSPMLAIARILRHKYGAENIDIIFIGPCIAKKVESEEIEIALTFVELRNILARKKIYFDDEDVTPSEFDEPFSGKGAIFPITRGLLHTIDKSHSIHEKDVINADGNRFFSEAIMELERGYLGANYLELLCCEGCIMGPGMSRDGKRFLRRAKIKKYVTDKLRKYDKELWSKQIEEFSILDFSRKIERADRRIPRPSTSEIYGVLRKMGKDKLENLLNCGACGYKSCEEHAIAVTEGLAELEMCLPYTIQKLHNSIEELNISNKDLAKARQALIQSEKLASMGQLSAGIAHELNNPLGVITMYSNILKEEVEPESQIHEDLCLIAENADRCKKIVSGLLNFARKNQIKLERTNITDFVKRSLDSIVMPKNVTAKVNSLLSNHFANIDYDQMMQVITNLEKNAVEAMLDGGHLELTITGTEDNIRISVKDNGTGIAPENMDKIFTPFFTTKPLGKGTGLGLPLIYGIIKMHKGNIEVHSNTDQAQGEVGTEFIITIPRN